MSAQEKLKEMKRELEEKVVKLEYEIKRARILIGLIEKALNEYNVESENELVSKNGKPLCKVYVGADIVRVVPLVHISADVPVFKYFLVNRIFKRLRERDVMSGKKNAFTYEIITDHANAVREIIMRNFSDEKILRELFNAIRWTLERV
jgi:hypothetical protein